jgi:hypothetical protein
MIMPVHIRRRLIIAHHLIWNGYGSWLSNDPRGSGSTEVRKAELRELGPAHLGRKVVQPSREELRAFHGVAAPLLDHSVAWFNDEARAVIAATTERVVRDRGYTCWAFCACSNHSHATVRVHRDAGHDIWRVVADATRASLVAAGLFTTDHPVWADRSHDVFKHDVAAVKSGIEYIEDNPEKEGLPRQFYPWVTPYNGWPLHRR